jgi:hypothetical protein
MAILVVMLRRGLRARYSALETRNVHVPLKRLFVSSAIATTIIAVVWGSGILYWHFGSVPLFAPGSRTRSPFRRGGIRVPAFPGSEPRRSWTPAAGRCPTP